MRDQYFGDLKDQFKYDLIEHLLTKLPSLRACALIVMLTPDEDKRDMRKPGSRNLGLHSYLEDCLRPSRRRVSEIAGYFRDNGMKMNMYLEPFYHEDRPRYFNNIKCRLLNDSLVFVDPDVGFEIKRSDYRHITYSEAGELFSRMGHDSVLMFFQHSRLSEALPETVSRICADLERVSNQGPLWISGIGVAFFFLTKKAGLRDELSVALSQYQQMYKDSTSVGVN